MAATIITPTDEQKEKLETLLQVPEGDRVSRFDRYRKGPVRISSRAFNLAVERYLNLSPFGRVLFLAVFHCFMVTSQAV